MDWSREAIAARVDHLAREHQGDAFVAAVAEFSRENLSRRERGVLYDVLMARANVRGMIRTAAEERRKGGWAYRLFRGEIGRRRPPR